MSSGHWSNRMGLSLEEHVIFALSIIFFPNVASFMPVVLKSFRISVFRMKDILPTRIMLKCDLSDNSSLEGPDMLRAILIYLSKAAWARKIITSWSFAWHAASRFVSGEKLEDAILVVKSLNNKGILATLDHLGEHTNTPDEARKATQDILSTLDALEDSKVRSNVSIKLTQLGLALGEDLCAENLAKILEHAREFGIFIRLDMEDAPWVEATLRLYHKMCAEKGLLNLGLVIQAYLYRSEKDFQRITQEGTKVRLCKGAYKEPAEIAFPKKADVDANYDRLAERLLDSSIAHGCQPGSADGKVPPIPGIATHDELRIEHAKAYAQKIGLPKNALEFQMLYGIRRDLQEKLVEEGYPVRVYVPYGTEWYPYYVRRLAERPANLWFFISNFFRK
jgi:proline dehydrogenase